MKNILSILATILFSFGASAQCSPAAITGTWYTEVGQSVPLYNSVSGGVWSVNDTNIATINSVTGVLRGKAIGYVNVRYTMPGECILFYSTLNYFEITSGIVGRANVGRGDTTTFRDIMASGTWQSSDTTIARVNDSTGLITGIKCGAVNMICRFSLAGRNYTTYQRLDVTTGMNGRKKICMGDTVVYRDTAIGGIWQCRDTAIAAIDTTTGVLLAKSVGMTFVTYTKTTMGTLCTIVDTVWVTKGLRSNRRICFGDTTTFVDSVAGGTWISADTSIVTINPSSGALYGRAMGTTSVTYALSSSRGTVIITDTIRVDAPPVIGHMTGPLTYCSGTSDTLRDGTASIRWSSSNSAVFAIDALIGRFTSSSVGAAPGYATIKYASSYCSFVYDSVHVVVNPYPNAGTVTAGATSMCPRDSVTFHSSLSGGWWSIDNYYWYHEYGHVAITATGVVTATAGLYEDTHPTITHFVSNSYGCVSSATASIHLKPSVNPGSIAGNATLNMGIIGNYSSTGAGASSQSWSITPSTIATISSTGQITPLATGVATIKNVAVNDCGADSVSRTITITPPAIGGVSSAFIGFVNRYCASPQFGVSVFPHTSSYGLKTYYGDGFKDSIALAAHTTTAITNYYHSYINTGTYTIKQVLINGTTPIDSVNYSYSHLMCNAISLSFYMDFDHNCVYTDSLDYVNYSPLRIIVDSNGVTIDTIPATSGLYYQESGSVGDVYSFRVLSSNVSVSCPSSGILYDTISSGVTGPKFKLVGLSCASSGFDLVEHTIVQGTGRHSQIMTISVDNAYCTAPSGTVTLNYDSRYAFADATPSPSSITATTVTWNLLHISSVDGTHPNILVHLERPGGTAAWLLPGDTVHSSISITSGTGGDLDTTNNNTQRVDTVKSSWDPNMMLVTPMGNVVNGTKLHYTIEFENDGNDTAKNIYVMDTLSDNVDLSTLELVTASARMNISLLKSGTHNIIKFDFPNIKLADSSHRLYCTGHVMFNIKAKHGLASGTQIYNHAGIFFDDNEVVMTDTSLNTILVPSLSVSSTCHDTICHAGSLHCNAVSTFVNTPHYQWYVNMTPAGADSLGFTTSSVVGGDSVICVMRNIQDDTMYIRANVLHIVERARPDSGTITGASVVCPGDNITLANAVAGGTWGITNARGYQTAGVVHGVTPGLDTISYTVTNICYSSTAIHPFTIHALPHAGVITGVAAICDTSVRTMIDTTSGGVWSVRNSHASISAGGVLTGLFAGLDTVVYRYINMCGSDTAIHAVRVDGVITPSAITGLSTVCQSQFIILADSLPGGTWTVSNSTASVTEGLVMGVAGGTDTVSYTINNSCGVFSASRIVTINPTLHPAISFMAMPGGPVCSGDTVAYSATFSDGGSSPIFTWQNGGTAIGAGANLLYTPSAGDIISCKMVSNAVCRSVDSVVSAAMPMIVNTSVTPSVSIMSATGDSVASYTGQLFTFYSSVTYGGSMTTYQWYVNGVVVPGATSGSYSMYVYSNDTVYCVVTGNAPCATLHSFASNIFIVYADYLEITQTKSTLGDMQLYPNPNIGNFVLNGDVHTSGSEAVTIEIRDVVNRLVYKASATPVNGKINERLELDNNLVPGSYYLRVFAGSDTKTLNFVISK